MPRPFPAAHLFVTLHSPRGSSERQGGRRTGHRQQSALLSLANIWRTLANWICHAGFLKQFACFPHAWNPLLKNSVKYCKRPKSLGLKKKNLGALTLPPPPLCFLESPLGISLWFVFSWWLLQVGATSCGYIFPFSFSHYLHVQPLLWGKGRLVKMLLLAPREICHPFQNLLGRSTILIYRFQVWTGVVLSSIYSDKWCHLAFLGNLSTHLPQFSQRVSCH